MTTASSLDAGTVVSALALALACYSTWITMRFNKRQTAFETTAEQLNRLLIEKEAGEAEANRSADISASFYKAGRTTYRLKVFNRGKGTARNVRFDVLDESDLFLSDDIERKFPIPSLEQHGAVELIAAVHMASPSRAHVRLTWDDDNGVDHTKELHPSW